MKVFIGCLKTNQPMKTYRELFLFLQHSASVDFDILDWLSLRDWKGKDKQEVLLRLFARLGLLKKISSFHICNGNFNLHTLRPQETLRDIFFTPDNKEVSLKDKGDSSDLTGILDSNPRHLLVCTSKCLNHMSMKKLDIDYIVSNFKQYEETGYTMTLCIVVKDAQVLRSTVARSERTSVELKKYLENPDTIVIDWKDLHEAYHSFKTIYGNGSFQELIAGNRHNTAPLVLRLHQTLCCLQTSRMKALTNTILWGHIQRSGKSYMMGGAILDDSKDKTKCNYLVMTTAPKETILQYLQVFEYSQFVDFNIVHLDGKLQKPVLTDKNIIVCSKQFLQSKIAQGEKTRVISWLKNMEFDMRFVDESHNGGTTELAQKTLDYYGKESFTVYITATYSKPTQHYSIPSEFWILWDMEDIQLCKRIDEERSVERLVEKHGEDFRSILAEYSTENIREDFSRYPELDVLTMKVHPDVLPEILEDTRENSYGWSTEACFLLKQGVGGGKEIVYEPEFQNKEENLKLWYTIFGKRNRFGIPDENYPDDMVFIKRIEAICKNPATSSRFVGEGIVMMAFLPPHHIDLVSQATKQLLEEENVVPDFDILCINSKTTTDPRQAVLDAKTRANNRGQKGVLVLSGRQCSLGVTIEDCDIVLLLNNSQSYDLVFQMMFRCMTEAEGKKRGFVIDLNIHRVVETILLEYGSVVQPQAHPRDAIRYLLQERLINLNSDHWKPCFGHGPSSFAAMTDSLYDAYSSRMSGALENLFRRMSLKQDLFSRNDYDVMMCIFDHCHPSSTVQKTKRMIWTEHEETVKKGIEKTSVEAPVDTPVDNANNPDTDIRLDPIDILRPISIVISLLTIHDNDKTTLEEMFSLMEEDQHHDKKSILLNQVRVWWGKGISSENVDILVGIFRKYLEKDIQTTQLIRQVKELFCKNIRNSKELSKIIDKYLIPQETEKKKNAEVSTPYSLRQDMLESVPAEFWTEKRKVLEPCCGKGGFLMDIVDKFMTGLEGKYPDEKQRYKEIVEDCLYFCDINDMNIFICRLLLDPYHEYALQYNEGDTLVDLDDKNHLLQEKWGLEGFDMVVCNPPYNSPGNTGTGNTIWQGFVCKALETWTRRGEGCYLVFVHPSGWRKPNTEKGKFTGLYHRMVSENYIQRLSIHGVKDGMKTFRCGTRYDWYVMERVESRGRTTRIRDEKGNEVEEIMGEGWEWFPNHSHEKVKRLLAQPGEERCPILYSRNAYGADKKEWMSSVKDENHPYVCIHTTPKKGVRYMYSRVNNRGMFGVPKIIFGDSGQEIVVEDLRGEYGMTQHAMGIAVRDSEESKNLMTCFQKEGFHELVEMCSWSSFALDWNIFSNFKRDFWKFM